MDADLVGYILHTVAFQIEGLQRLPVCQCQISVSAHIFTSFAGPLPHPVTL